MPYIEMSPRQPPPSFARASIVYPKQYTVFIICHTQKYIRYASHTPKISADNIIMLVYPKTAHLAFIL